MRGDEGCMCSTPLASRDNIKCAAAFATELSLQMQ